MAGAERKEVQDINKCQERVDVRDSEAEGWWVSTLRGAGW